MVQEKQHTPDLGYPACIDEGRCGAWSHEEVEAYGAGFRVRRPTVAPDTNGRDDCGAFDDMRKSRIHSRHGEECLGRYSCNVISESG